MSVHGAMLIGSVRWLSNLDDAPGIGDELPAGDVPMPVLSLQGDIHRAAAPRADDIHLEARPSFVAVIVDVPDPVQLRMRDTAHCVLHGRVVLGEIQRDGGWRATAHVYLAQHDHHKEDDEPSLKRPFGFRRDADSSQHFLSPHWSSA
jgi:hypothetical protein